MKSVRLFGSVLLVLLAACSDENGSKPPLGDSTPPGRVTDLTAFAFVNEVIALTWTAPGDDGMEGRATSYEVRYGPDSLTAARWDSAVVVPGAPDPKPAGQPENFSMVGLPPGHWFFALRAADDVPNWSDVSNIVASAIVDTIPPNPVTDLAIGSTTATSLTLTWTAPGDDRSSGRATTYDLRSARSTITEETWDDATRHETVPAPDSAGAEESFAVAGLERDEIYYFALKTADNGRNWSELSNVANGATRSLWQLTNSGSPSGATGPKWSPDGERIAFAADWTAQFRFQIYLIPPLGGAPVQLTHIAEGATRPAWSPDGVRLTFVSLREDYPHTLFELSVIDAVPGAEPVRLASHGRGAFVQSPSWSPDGTRIAYPLWTGIPPVLLGEIYTISSAGGSPQQLFTGNSYIGSVAWSPDGTQIAFASGPSESSDIWVIPATGGQATQLTTDPAGDVDPAWSPDGSRIAFASDRSGSSLDIWVMSATGENPMQLTFDPEHEGAPSWSPDGRQICFAARKHEIVDLWVLALD